MTRLRDWKGYAGEALFVARGLRLIDVGMSLDICYQQVQAWESGRRNPGTKYLVRLAELLGLELADLIPRGPCATVC